MGANQIRDSGAALVIRGEEKLGPAVAKAKAHLAAFAVSAKKYGGVSIGSPVPQQAVSAAAAAIASPTGPSRPQLASVSKGAVQAVPAAMEELAGSIKAIGQSGTIAAKAMRDIAAAASEISAASFRVTTGLGEVAPAMRAMGNDIRTLGKAAERFGSSLHAVPAVAAVPRVVPTATRAGGVAALATIGGALGAGLSSALVSTTSAATVATRQFGKSWQLAGEQMRAAGSIIHATGGGISNVGRLTRGLAGDMMRLGVSMKFAGIATLGLLAASVRSFVTAGSAAFDMSQRLGISAEAWSELAFAARQAGATTDSLEMSLRKMQDVIVGAGMGSESAAKALGSIGLFARDLLGLAPEDQLEVIADRVASVSDPAARTAIALDLFGRNAGKLLPLLAGGARGLRAARDEARRLGISIGTAEAAAADRLGDSLGALGALARRAFSAVGASIEPAVSKSVEIFASATRGAIRWVAANREVVQSVAAVGVGLVAAGAILAAAAPIVGALGTGIVALGTVLGLAGSAFTALASPIGLVAAGLAAALAGTLALSGGLGVTVSAIGVRAVAGLQAIRMTAGEAVAGIVTAFRAGDVETAGKILWKGLEIGAQQGANAIADIWDSVMSEIPTTWEQMVTRMSAALSVIKSEVTSIFDAASTALSEDIVGFFATEMPGWAQQAYLGVDNSDATEADLQTAFRAERDRTEARVRARKEELEEILKASREEFDRQKAGERNARGRAGESRDAGIAALQKEMDELRKRAEDAQRRKAAIDSDRSASDRQSMDDTIRRLSVGRDAAMERVEAASAVTFSGSRASGLGSGTVERLNRAAERTAKNTELLQDLLDAMRDGMPGFGEG
jgi:hypothetical protein